MKKLLPILALTFALLAPAFAQDPAQEEVPLIPAEIPQNEKPRGTALDTREKKSKTDQSTEELMERIRIREARTKAERDPQVQAEWANATAAKKDYYKREALKAYYTALYGRMVKIDPSLKKTLELHKAAALRRLEQTRIDPTEPPVAAR